MLLRYSSLLIALLCLTAPAAAQGFQASQGLQPSQGFQPTAPQAAPAQQEPPCFKDFIKLRQDTEKHGKAVTAAGQRKASPQEACKLFNTLVTAERKLVKYVEDNATWCGIPPQVLTQLKEQDKQASQVRDRICQVASRGPTGPRAPTLSDALGTSVTPDASTVRTGRGTFDTLTGSPLGQK
jgi:hypothetical protein